MAIRLSGINSGLDTDAIIQELVSAYSLKTEKYEKQKTKLEWKQEAWQSLNTKIYGLYTKVSNLQYDSSYNLKKTTVSDSTKASVTASGEAVTGTQKLSITSTAQACYITGGRLGENITASTKLGDLGLNGETTLKIDKDGDENDSLITISETDTISSLMQKFKDAGVNANFDSNNQRIYISAKESGSAANFDLGSDDAEGMALLSTLGLTSATQEVDSILMQVKAYKADVEEWDENYDDATYDKYKADIEAYEEAKARCEKIQARNDAYTALKNIVEAGNGKFTAEELMDVINEGKDVKEYLRGEGIELSDDQISAIASDIETISKYSTDEYGSIVDVTAEELVTELESAQSALEYLKDEYDVATKAVALKDRIDSYSDSIINIANLTDEEKTAAIGELLAEAEESKKFATKIEGTNAVIVLNDVEYKSTSNSFSINGLTIEALATTDGEISITTAVDTQGIYDKIKDFLTEYNTVINEITKLYNADSAKDYEPLTDDEKDAMSETEIEKWENKIKSALLRRDSSLGSVMNAMINSMAQTYEVDGQKLSLGNFGISTLGYLNAAENEQYAYHIDGDEDDESTSGKTDKLMAAIQTNPDQIVEFMKQLTKSLYKSIDEKMKSTELSSVYKVYNDKEMDDELSDIEDLIEKWEEKVAEQEDYYYSKFSDMEVALSKLQSQTSALSGLLGS